MSSICAAVELSYDDMNRLKMEVISDGTILNYTYDEAGNRLSRVVTVPDADGDDILPDGDGNGVPGDNPCTAGATTNCDDNCPLVVNVDQADANGDGIGDVCQCGDTNRNGFITNADASLIRASIFGLFTLPADSLCDTNNSGTCTNADASRIRAYLFGLLAVEDLSCAERAP